MNVLIGLALLLVVIIITQRSWPTEPSTPRRKTLFRFIRGTGVQIVLIFIGALLSLVMFMAATR